MVHVSSGGDVLGQVETLATHFQTVGSPVMIGMEYIYCTEQYCTFVDYDLHVNTLLNRKCKHWERAKLQAYAHLFIRCIL